MNIRISRGERIIRLTKRERDQLAGAKRLLIEIAKQQQGVLSELADLAADKIGEIERELASPSEVVAPY